jgi:seryl-tRNA synthetase
MGPPAPFRDESRPMLDIKWIRDNPDRLAEALGKRGISSAEAKATVADVVARDEARRAHILKLEEAQARRNAASKEIGKAKAAKDEAAAEKLMAEVGELKTFLSGAESKGREFDKALEDALAVIPNLPLDDVPVGADEHANVQYRMWGTKPAIDNAKEHFELGEAMGGMDFEAAAKLSGSRFVVLRGQLARMERALGQFMLDLHTTEHGYTEVQPPLLVRDEAFFGTGQLPKFEVDLYKTTTTMLERLGEIGAELRSARGALDDVLSLLPLYEEQKKTYVPNPKVSLLEQATTPERMVAFYEERRIALADRIAALEAERAELLKMSESSPRLRLIPTAEVPLTNLVRESIRDEVELPIRVTALTPCFRSEAGAAGKDTRGMLRQHQFDKVELVSITTPETSRDEHERMLVCAEEVLKRLELHYRVMTLSTGDMGFGAQKTYDIEVWLPGQGTYREISSCSLCGDFQARRMQARYRAKEGKGTRFVHTLNGSGVAVGRCLIAVMENYQNPDGSITVPEALKPYMGGIEKIGG